MTTPSGKHPIDPFAYVSHDMREPAGLERDPIASGNELLRSPYAPTRRAHERSGAERYKVENDRDLLQSSYAPKKARIQPAGETGVPAGEDAAPRAAKGLRKHPDGDAVDADEPHLFSHDGPSGAQAQGGPLFNTQNDRSLKAAPEDVAAGADPVDSGSATLLQPAHPDSRRRERPAAARRDETIRGLERPEATVRWVQREQAVVRIPRAPVPGFDPINARGRRHSVSYDVLQLSVRPPRSLKRERLRPPPAMTRRDKLGGPLGGGLIAAMLAAPIGYYIAVGGWGPSSEGAQMATGPIINVPPASIVQQEPWLTATRDDDGGTSAQSEIASKRTEPSRPARSSEDEAVAMVQPGAAGAQAAPASKGTRVLDPEEIKLFMKQGEQFIAAGDVVTARIVFQRAAEAGDANAAMALGATYDPTVLAKLGVVGMSADVEKARSWYQTAEKLGSPEARRRLDVLADR